MYKDSFLTAIFIILVCILGVVYIFYNHKKQPVVHCNHIPNREYLFDITDDSIFVYTEDDKFVGGVKLQGQLDSLLIQDNK